MRNEESGVQSEKECGHQIIERALHQHLNRLTKIWEIRT